jgi:hypothetical protein
VNTDHGKLIPDCPVGFRVEDGKLVRESEVLPPPILFRRESPLTKECKGRTFTLTDDDSHIRLWGLALRKKERYSRAGELNMQKLSHSQREQVIQGRTVISR